MEKKIAIYIPSLRGGGAERVMLNLAKGFADQGIQVDLVLAKAEGAYLPQVPPNINMVDLKASRVLFSLPALVGYLRRHKPAAIFSALNHANVIAVWAVKLARVKTRIIVGEHSTLSRSLLHPQNRRARLVPYLMRYAYSQADEIVAVSRGVAQDLAAVLGIRYEDIRVIYNPVVDENLLEKSKADLNHQWFQPGQPPVILAVGRLTEAKDFPNLIQAFAEVRKKCRARLMILGEGEKRAELEKMVVDLGLEKDVAMPGFVDNPYPYMRRAKVVVLSSKWEGLPTVLVEALACGTAVVSTDCPSGPREILRDGKYGILVPVRDSEQLGKAILQVISDKVKEKTGYSNYLDLFISGNVLAQYLELA